MNNSHRHQPWADLAVFENLTDGQALTQQLKDQGFEARAYDDKAFRYFLFLRPPQITYRVQVRRDDVTAATAFLTTRSPVVLAKAIHCPDCGSLHINYPQMTRRFILPTVLLHLGIIFRVIHHEAYCEGCHFTWELAPLEKPVLPELKVSGH
ncbi:MAG TPA: hypothetical protein VK815_13800 [Candidatus Acidoferrales bacterium]|nr:hypothetical protein [Candidatus Acidoferrales bacterium]